MKRVKLILILACCVAFVGCVEDPEPPVEPPGPLVVDDLPRATYDALSTPRVALPEDPQARDALSAPLAQIGGDDGNEGLVYAAALGGYYIMRIQEPGGGFGYRYDPRTDSWADDDSIARQCGATYTLGYLYELTGREEFRIAAEWSHARIAQNIDKPLTLYSPLALWTLGLTLHSRAVGHTGWGQGFDVNTEVNKLGAYLLSIQREDGSFLRGGFHAGAQFLQAYWSLYTHTGDERYIDAMEKGARWFYDTGAHEFDVLFALWSNEPMIGLYSLRPAPWILELTWMVTDPLLDAQILPHHDVYEDWYGGFILYGQPAPGAMSMYGVESFIDAFRLARLAGDTERAERYKAAAIYGTRFLKTLQFRGGDTDIYPQPDMMIGGVPFGLERPVLRVDITRHLANTFIKVVTYLDLEDFPSRERFLPRSKVSGGVLDAPFGVRQSP